jgi:hypothetical protein
MADSCKHSNKPSSHKKWVIQQLSDHQLLNKDSDPCSYGVKSTLPQG